MLKKYILICVLFITCHAFGQDTLPPPPQELPPDTAAAVPPVIRVPKKHVVRKKDTTAVADTFQSVRTILKFTGISFDTMVLKQHPYFTFTNPVRYSVS